MIRNSFRISKDLNAVLLVSARTDLAVLDRRHAMAIAGPASVSQCRRPSLELIKARNEGSSTRRLVRSPQGKFLKPRSKIFFFLGNAISWPSQGQKLPLNV